MTIPKQERLRSHAGQRIGAERYTLLRAAFRHAQAAIRDGYYIEAIAVLDSILTDRLGSLLYGVIRQRVELEQTIGNLLHKWEHIATKQTRGPKVAAPTSVLGKIPKEIAEFLKRDLQPWGKARNDAVHGMAKLHQKGDLTFATHYATLERIALEGVQVLHRLDAFDCAEKEAHGKVAATKPGALRLDADLQQRIYGKSAPAS